MLEGNYSFTTIGSYDGYYPSAGMLTFDGKGHVSGVMSAIYDYDSDPRQGGPSGYLDGLSRV